MGSGRSDAEKPEIICNNIKMFHSMKMLVYNVHIIYCVFCFDFESQQRNKCNKHNNIL